MPVSGVLTSCATPAASRPIEAIFSEICSCSSSCTRAVTSSTMTIVPTVVTPRPSEARSGTTAALTIERCARVRVPRATSGTRDSVAPAGASRRAHANRLDERRVEDLVEPAARGLVARDAVCLLEGRVPAQNAIVEVDDEQTVVERFEDVLVERAHAIELDRLDLKLPIEPRVLERRGNLAGDGRQQRRVLAVEVTAGAPCARARARAMVPSLATHGTK